MTVSERPGADLTPAIEAAVAIMTRHLGWTRVRQDSQAYEALQRKAHQMATEIVDAAAPILLAAQAAAVAEQAAKLAELNGAITWETTCLGCAKRLDASYADHAVIEAAKVWRTARHDQNSGMTFHHACQALDDAVAILVDALDRDPIAPPTEAELERGREIVRRAQAYSAALAEQDAAIAELERQRDEAVNAADEIATTLALQEAEARTLRGERNWLLANLDDEGRHPTGTGSRPACRHD